MTTGGSGRSVRGSVMIAPIFCTTGSPPVISAEQRVLGPELAPVVAGDDEELRAG